MLYGNGAIISRVINVGGKNSVMALCISPPEINDLNLSVQAIGQLVSSKYKML